MDDKLYFSHDDMIAGIFEMQMQILSNVRLLVQLKQQPDRFKSMEDVNNYVNIERDNILKKLFEDYGYTPEMK
jgi:hypothetical protein